MLIIFTNVSFGSSSWPIVTTSSNMDICDEVAEHLYKIIMSKNHTFKIFESFNISLN